MMFFPEGIGGLGSRFITALKANSRREFLRMAVHVPAIICVLVSAVFILELFGASFGSNPGRGASAAARVVKTAKIWGLNVEVLSVWSWFVPALILAASLAVLRAPFGRLKQSA
jgi:branched-subunit amino acid ABC-type transport system permease component